jgi:exodeoxyribonuclease VII large subunit
VEALSLFELNEHIRRVIALNFQESLWVRCEIAQVKESRGHFYLDLVEKVPEKDEILAQMQGVIWAKTAWIIKRKLKHVFNELLRDGMEVRLKVRVDYHERYGLKVNIEDIDPAFTLGNIEARKREIVEALYGEGLIGLNAQRPIPMVLQRVAILSTEQAAGYQDFRKHLLQNSWQFRFWLDLYPIAVQGAYVEEQLLAAMDRIHRVKHHYDCIVIIRGGGSRLDLSAFDSIEIGRAIARSPIPVFTGIGHEIDASVADAVAHTALKTPTAVADFLIEVNATYAGSIRELFSQITDRVQRKTDRHKQAIGHLGEMIRRTPQERISRLHLLLDQIRPGLLHAAGNQLRRHHDLITHSTSLLQMLDPKATLERGFSITTLDGKWIRSTTGVTPGDEITTHILDGTIESTVTQT